MPANVKVPVALDNYNLYLGDKGERLIGIGNVELPEAACKTVEVNMAGMAGSVNVVLTGQTDPLKTTINCPALTKQLFSAAAPDQQLITARGALEVYDTASGRKEIQKLVVTMRFGAQSIKFGSLEKGAAMDSSIAGEVDYIKITLHGSELLEIDKWSNIYRINGVDYGSNVRDAI